MAIIAARAMIGLARDVAVTKSTALLLADSLDNAERLGAATDEPEGARYVIISDTLAKQWSDLLRTLISRDEAVA